MSSRILVVDDDARQRRSLALGLSVSGFAALEASGGDEALALVEQQRPDLVITDLMMPGVTGLHLIRRLHDRFPELPVVLTSAYEIGRRQLESAGLRVLAFVPKPYDLAELSEFLRNKLRGQAKIRAIPAE